LRAFSSGAVALTGIEAISNGVPAFKKPESKNAASTLIVMGVILGSFFLGIAVLANLLKPTVSENETLLSILGGAVFGDGTVPYYVLQFATFAILILAANTAFADFPASARSSPTTASCPASSPTAATARVLERIIALAAVASVLIIGFGGQTSALIPLYAVGVFCGFTLSQLGMVVHHKRLQARAGSATRSST
jgi:amino acid transporter